jgi:microcystin degradation protein MlrC
MSNRGSAREKHLAADGMTRIAVGGFGQESNSFVPDRADFAYFATHRDRPPLVRGAALFDWLSSGSFPICAFIGDMQPDHCLVPLVWAHGGGGGIVTDDAFERIVGELVGRLSEALPVHAVYLDLHGAMVSESFEDAEAEILRRVRAVVGDIPIVVSLDFHANLSPEMVEYSDAILAYETYPHIDRPETGLRAARVMRHILEHGRPTARAFRKIPFLLPATAQCTMVGPSQIIASRSKTLEGECLNVAYAAGFLPSDLYWCGPAVAVHGYDQAVVDREADSFERLILSLEREFTTEIIPVRQAVEQAISIGRTASRPVVLADIHDNPGSGGSGDTTGVLQELLRAGAEQAVIGILCDPEAAQMAHDAGEGAEVSLNLGGRFGPNGVCPVAGNFLVVRLGSGQFTATGAVWGGQDIDLGPMALLSIAGVSIVVSSRRMQAFDLAPFRHVGVEPATQKIVVVKSKVHFRAEFQPIAETVVLVNALGGTVEGDEPLPYRKLRAGVRFRPMSERVST